MQKILTKKDILGWDICNWSGALSHWERVLPKDAKLTCIELGANQGGLSLWLASLGHEVVCSDYIDIKEEIKKNHSEFNVNGKLSYECIDMLDIPYENHFDVIILKSVLGGVGRDKNDERIQRGINQIYKALKPNGYFLFAENAKATRLHSFLRNKFVNWGNNWNYLDKDQLKNKLNKFNEIKLYTSGFLGILGFNERIRQLLGKIDKLVFNYLPSSYHYIVYGHAKK